MSNPSPSWDDYNKLKEQNAQMRLWIEQQRRYIKALARVIPPSLIEDLASTLPPLPDIPESLFLLEPKRLLDSPIDEGSPFNSLFPEKPKLPPRESSAAAIRMMGIPAADSPEKMSEDGMNNEILDHYPASESDEYVTQDNKHMQEHELLYLAYESNKDGASSQKMSPHKSANGSSPNLQKTNENGDGDYRVEVLHTTRSLTPKGKEAMSLIISLYDIQKNEEVCRLDKQYSHLAILDVYVSFKVISHRKLKKKDPIENFPVLPEKHLFQTFSPYKFDSRKSEVELYLNLILSRYGNWKEVKHFIRTNKYEPVKLSSVMEGFLFRAERQGASWKARYYYIKDGVLAYSERPGEPQISSIDLKNMTVSRMADVPSPTENDNCHAFILYESKSSSTDINQEKQHMVFSCDSDKERDLWVLHLANEILKYRPRDRMISKEVSDLGFKESIPRRSSSKELNDGKASIKSESSGLYAGISQLADLNIISRKKSERTESAEAKNSVGKFFKSKTTSSTDKPLPQTKRIFGSPLNDAVEISQISKNLPIPAVVFRCIEYLEHKKVWDDEGIYRLSGMSTEITYLKGKFESDLDFDLINQEEIFDTNAVAGLLKLYFRELPAPLFPDTDKSHDGKKNIEMYQIALSKIPDLNYVLLKTIFGHLSLIASHASVNKMSPQNLSIIFSPTLQLSPITFSVFLQDYDSVFKDSRYSENS